MLVKRLDLAFVFQNMIHFEKVLPPVHDVYLELRGRVENKGPPPTEEEMKEWAEQLKGAAKAINERVFVIMTAQFKGWSFAKELDFLQSGIYICYYD